MRGPLLMSLLIFCSACKEEPVVFGLGGPPSVRSCECPEDETASELHVIDEAGSRRLIDQPHTGRIYGIQGGFMTGLRVEAAFADRVPECFRATVEVLDRGEVVRSYNTPRPVNVLDDDEQRAVLGTHWDTDLLDGVFDVRVSGGGREETVEDVHFGVGGLSSCASTYPCGLPAWAGDACSVSRVCGDAVTECIGGRLATSAHIRTVGSGTCFVEDESQAFVQAIRAVRFQNTLPTPDQSLVILEFTRDPAVYVSYASCVAAPATINGDVREPAITWPTTCDGLSAAYRLDELIDRQLECGEEFTLNIEGEESVFTLECPETVS